MDFARRFKRCLKAPPLELVALIAAEALLVAVVLDELWRWLSVP